MKSKDYLTIIVLAVAVAVIYAIPASRGDVGWWLPVAVAVATFAGGWFVLKKQDNVFVQPLPIGFGIALGLSLVSLKANFSWWLPFAVGAAGYLLGLIMFRIKASLDK